MAKILNVFNKMWQAICSWTASGIGIGIGTTGIIIKELAIVAIMIGILLWMFKCTKVFRWGAVGYILGLVLEILGSLMV